MAMEKLTSVAELCVQSNLTPEELAERASLDKRRARAIVAGRWTPSPEERDRVAAIFGLTRDMIAWGQHAPISHVYGHGPQFGRSP
jgi:hypothetical protein